MNLLVDTCTHGPDRRGQSCPVYAVGLKSAVITRGCLGPSTSIQSGLSCLSFVTQIRILSFFLFLVVWISPKVFVAKIPFGL